MNSNCNRSREKPRLYTFRQSFIIRQYFSLSYTLDFCKNSKDNIFKDHRPKDCQIWEHVFYVYILGWGYLKNLIGALIARYYVRFDLNFLLRLYSVLKNKHIWSAYISQTIYKFIQRYYKQLRFHPQKVESIENSSLNCYFGKYETIFETFTLTLTTFRKRFVAIVQRNGSPGQKVDNFLTLFLFLIFWPKAVKPLRLP